MLLLWLALQAAPAPPAPHRPYHVVTVDELASGSVVWAHVHVEGRLRLVRREPDGDWHLKLTGRRRFIVAECIPAIPCGSAPLGTRLWVEGIAREDREHGWWEVHPVERWGPAKP